MAHLFLVGAEVWIFFGAKEACYVQGLKVLQRCREFHGGRRKSKYEKGERKGEDNKETIAKPVTWRW